MEEKRKLLIFFTIGFVFLTVLIFMIFKPMLNTILLGFVFSFLMYPLYKYINKKTKNKKFSSFLVCLIFIIIFTTPLIIGVNNLAKEALSASRLILNSNILNNIGVNECTSDSLFCDILNKFFIESNVKDVLRDVIKSGASIFSNYIGSLLLKLPLLVLNSFIIIFMMYYLLMDGKKFMQRIYSLIPISNEHKHKLFKKTFNNLSGILFGTIAVAVIQGVLAGIGFAIFGFRSPILWGILTIFFALVPMLGAGIVWFPASVYKIFASYSTLDTTGIWMGIGLFIYGAIIVSTLDNFIRPLLVSGKTRIHPVLVLFGIIGGISVFGAAGIFIGPLILGIFMTLLEMFEEEKDELFSNQKKSKLKINNNALNKNKKILLRNTYCDNFEKMPDGMSCLITRKDYNLLQEYKRSVNSNFTNYLNKLKIPIIGLQKLSKCKDKKNKNIRNAKIK
jgi:predicted PurR-regulated permease PerM